MVGEGLCGCSVGEGAGGGVFTCLWVGEGAGGAGEGSLPALTGATGEEEGAMLVLEGRARHFLESLFLRGWRGMSRGAGALAAWRRAACLACMLRGVNAALTREEAWRTARKTMATSIIR